MGEWKEYRLGDLIQTGKAGLQTGPFGTMLNASEYVEHGLPVIAVQDIGENKLKYSKLKYIGAESELRLVRYKVKAGDIIFGRKGAVDRRALITAKEEGWIQGSDCIRLRFTKTIDAKFISYQLGCNHIKNWLIQHSHGATMPSLNQEILSLLPLTIPPFTEQKAIAAVLSSLDDKIDLLHRQNKTLEALAETLFRQWFVEEAGEGWEDGVLGDIIELAYGKSLKSSERTGSGYPVVGSSGIVDFHSEYLVNGPGIVIGRKGTLGKTIYLEENFYPIDTTYYVKPKRHNNKLFFEYFLLKNINFGEMNTDSAVPGLNRNIALGVELLIPPNEIVQRFNEFTSEIYQKRRNNQIQIRTLEKLRDTLLPRLMSGEVRVSAL